MKTELVYSREPCPRCGADGVRARCVFVEEDMAPDMTSFECFACRYSEGDCEHRSFRSLLKYLSGGKR